MKTLPLGCCILILAGCATATRTISPNGNPVFSISCGAAAQSACYQKAGEVCPSGYNILSANGSRYMGQLATANVNAYGGSASSVPMMTRNELFIECK